MESLDAERRWSMWLAASGRARGTITLRTRHLSMLRRAAGPPLTLDGEELVTWFASQAWAPATRRSVAATLRGFYGWAYREGLRPDDPTHALPPVRRDPPRPHPADELAIGHALASADERLALMVRLGAEAGLRRAEIAGLRVRDLVRERDGWTLVVDGKGGRRRFVPVSGDLARAMQLYARTHGAPWVFPSPAGGHLTPGWVGRLLGRAVGTGAHSLRHRCATVAYDRSGDLLAVQELLGHSSPETTRVYVRLSRSRLRAVVDGLEVAPASGLRAV